VTQQISRSLRACTLAAVVTVAAMFGAGIARAETAIGAVFGYPGNVGLSLRFDRTPINVAWSEDFIHGTIDVWMRKNNINENLDWYLGPGIDAGIPLDDDDDDFFFAARLPIGLQYMASPKIELFGEVAPGFQFVDDTDFYWASNVGIRFVLGQ
jgi:hypothetical protein